MGVLFGEISRRFSRIVCGGRSWVSCGAFFVDALLVIADGCRAAVGGIAAGLIFVAVVLLISVAFG
jgi:hypothetical protein